MLWIGESIVKSQVPKADEIEYASIPRILIDSRNFVTQTTLTYPNIPTLKLIQNQPFFLPMELNHQRKQVSAKLIALLSHYSTFL